MLENDHFRIFLGALILIFNWKNLVLYYFDKSRV